MWIPRTADRPVLTRPHPLATLQRLVDSTTGAHALTVLRNDLRADGVVVPPHTLHGFRHAGTGPASVIAVLAAPDALPLPPPPD